MVIKNKKLGKVAICYTTNGNRDDVKRLEISAWSVRKFIGDDVPILSITEDHWVPSVYGMTNICPTQALWKLGFFSEGWGRRMPFAVLYRLVIPLLPEFENVDTVIYLDTDTLVLSHSARQLLLEAELPDAEIIGAPDVDRLKARNKVLLEKDIDRPTATIMKPYWDKWGTATKDYINAGVVIFNLKKIRENGLDWYEKRMKLFWGMELRGKLAFLDQDALNILCDVNTSLDPRLNVITEQTSDAIIRHYAGISKPLQIKHASTLEYKPYLPAMKKIDGLTVDISDRKQLVMYISHIFNDETLWRYRKLKSDVAGLNIDVIWIYNKKPDLPEPDFPKDVWVDYITDEEVYSDKRYLAPPDAGMSLQFQGPNYMAMKMALKYDKYDYVWYLEYDVCFSGNWADFFRRMNGLAHDLVCERVVSRYDEPRWFWWKASRDIYPWCRSFKSVNCISRLSRNLINVLQEFYESNKDDPPTFFETAWATIAINEYSCYDLYKNECDQIFSVNKIKKPVNVRSNRLYHAIKDDITWARYLT